MTIKTTPKNKKKDGRTIDLTLQWLVNNHGQEWETWRQLGEEWITNQDSGTDSKLESLCFFWTFISQVLFLGHPMS